MRNIDEKQALLGVLYDAGRKIEADINPDEVVAWVVKRHEQIKKDKESIKKWNYVRRNKVVKQKQRVKSRA